MSSSDLNNINLNVVIVDTDFYAMQAVNSYLAWDRRTRVTWMSDSLDELWAWLGKIAEAELPDVVMIDIGQLDAQALFEVITRLRDLIPDLKVICLAQVIDPALVEAAAEAGAGGFLLKQDVRFQIAWAIVYAYRYDFIVTTNVARIGKDSHQPRLYEAHTLPEQRRYPELTARLRQAIRLCVIEGMPAHLAADEMAISLHTIRGYVKEGYRILEAYDETEYPVDMTPQEKAFMRFTAFADDRDDTAEDDGAVDEDVD